MKSKEINILVIDDDNSVLTSIAEGFKREGFNPILASRPDEARRAIKIKAIHGIVADCMLPSINGVDLVQELKAGVFEDTPIVLVSGIYKDKNFAVEGIKKTGAIQFLNKPLDMTYLIKLFKGELESLLVSEEVSKIMLVMKTFKSDRERRRSIEHMDDLCGYDIPLIIKIYMDTACSGYINIAKENGDLVGITLYEGKICNVDTPERDTTDKSLILKNGFMEQSDLNEILLRGHTGSLVKYLIENSLISPHAESIIREQQVKGDLKKLVGPHGVSLNFVPDNSIKNSLIQIDSVQFSFLTQDYIRELFSADWLNQFYEEINDYPVCKGKNWEKLDGYLNHELLKALDGIKESLTSGSTVRGMVESAPDKKKDYLKCVYWLAIQGIVIFDTERKGVNLGEFEARVTSMKKDLKGKDVFKIFQYFGARPHATDKEIGRIFKDFSRTYHPDILSMDASEELKKNNNDLFASVSSAHDILVHEGKKKKYLQSMNQEKASVEMKNEKTVEDAKRLLERGHPKEAWELVKNILSDGNSSTYVILIYTWARLKGDANLNSKIVDSELSKLLENIPSGDRRTALYFLVQGIFRKNVGDVDGARSAIEKAIQTDPKLLICRRELSILGSKKKDMNLKDVLSGDLGDVFNHFFKKS